MLDSTFSNNASIVGSIERGLSGILTGSSMSAASDGVTGYLTIPHISQYQFRSDNTPIDDFTIYFWFQMDVLPVQQFVFLAKDSSGMPGGWSIEAWTSGGVTRLRSYLKNASGQATFLGGSTGVGTLAAETAYRVAFVYDAGTARIYLNDGPPLATQVVAGGSMVGNTRSITVFGYGAGLALADAIMDDIVIVDRALTEAQINALDDAVTISHNPGSPPPPSEEGFTCPGQGGTEVNTHANLGTTTQQQVLEGGPNKIYNFLGTHVTNTYDPVTRVYNPSYCIRGYGPPVTNSCLYGGSVSKGLADYHIRETLPDGRRLFEWAYPENDAGQIFMRDTDHIDVMFEGWRLHQNWDPIRISDHNNARQHDNITIRKVWMTDVVDDAIENDNHYGNISIVECLIERCFVYWSDRNTSSARSGQGVCTTSDCLIWMDDILHSSQTYWQQRLLYKLNSRATSFDIYNTYFRFGAINPADFPNRHPFYELLNYGKLRNSANNVILWTDNSSYPAQIPPGFTVQTGAAALDTWNTLAAAWKANHDYVPRMAGFDP